jgi:hypothetical protein
MRDVACGPRRGRAGVGPREISCYGTRRIDPPARLPITALTYTGGPGPPKPRAILAPLVGIQRGFIAYRYRRECPAVVAHILFLLAERVQFSAAGVSDLEH